MAKHVELSSKSRPLPPLKVGSIVQVQNQRGTKANKWDLSGTVVECQEFDSYLVKMDGSGRITKRNRRYLRPIVPFIKDSRLPLQQFETELRRDSQPAESTSNVHDESNNGSQTQLTQPPRPDPFDQSVRMSDAQFDAGLLHAADNVQKEGDKQPRAVVQMPTNPPTRSKRVKFETKRFIKEF